jgi:beta-lactamase class D
MNSPHLLKIEQELRNFSLEQLEWLLERIAKQVQARKHLDKFTNLEYMNEQLVTMASDVDIQTEIASINNEFSVTEMDGLEKL